MKQGRGARGRGPFFFAEPPVGSGGQGTGLTGPAGGVLYVRGVSAGQNSAPA